MEVYLRVRRAVMVEWMSIREAAREFGLHRDTVRNMMAYSVRLGYRRQTPPHRPKLEPYTGVIDQISKRITASPGKQRHTAKHIYEWLRDEYGWRKLLTTVHMAMDRPNHPTSHRTVQRLVRMAGRMNWLTEPLEKITRVIQWFTKLDPSEDIDSDAPGIIARYQ